MNIIIKSPAKFALGPQGSSVEAGLAPYCPDLNMRQRAEIEIDGVHFFSRVPASAMDALKINRAVEGIAR